jgi:hypothetical protein
MTDKGIGIETIIQFEDFPEILRRGRDASEFLYLVQCKVSRMKLILHYKSYYQDNKAPILYWPCSKKATKPS